MSGICDTCRRKCHARTDELKTCDFYIGGESNYTRLFGTPERVAKTLHRGTLNCRECLIREQCAETPEDSKCMIMYYDTLLEWLKSS